MLCYQRHHLILMSHFEEEKQSSKVYANPESVICTLHKVLTISFSSSGHMRAGGQSSPLSFHPPTDSIIVIPAELTRGTCRWCRNQISESDGHLNPISPLTVNHNTTEHPLFTMALNKYQNSWFPRLPCNSTEWIRETFVSEGSGPHTKSAESCGSVVNGPSTWNELPLTLRLQCVFLLQASKD